MGGWIPADDDELLFVDGLDLQPLPGAARFVHRGAALGDDAFPSGLLCTLQRRVAAGLDFLGDLDGGGGALQRLLQNCAALVVSEFAEIFAVEPEDVEDDEDLAP